MVNYNTEVGYPKGHKPELPKEFHASLPRVPCDPMDAIDPEPYGWTKPTLREQYKLMILERERENS